MMQQVYKKGQVVSQWNEAENKFNLYHDRWVSTNLEGISKILAGANPNEYLTQEEFLNNAIRKGKEDGVLNDQRRT